MAEKQSEELIEAGAEINWVLQRKKRLRMVQWRHFDDETVILSRLFNFYGSLNDLAFVMTPRGALKLV